MAKVVVQNALTPLTTKVDYRVVPSVTFTDPEVARVGLTLDEAAAAGERAENAPKPIITASSVLSDLAMCRLMI